jgi:FkbH-like protein
VRVNDVADFERLSQMTEKTNQFNFNKKHYSVQALYDFIANEKGMIYSLKVSDKYGDYGTTGMMLIKTETHNAFMENYIISCRILGRRIENSFLDVVVNDLNTKQINLKSIKFIETAKNKPAQEFLNNVNYEIIH